MKVIKNVIRNSFILFFQKGTGCPENLTILSKLFVFLTIYRALNIYFAVFVIFK